ncbi:ATP-binding protein [Streptomyces incarnatus]
MAEDRALIVSELVADAVQHARRESIRFVIDRPGTARVRVVVADLSRVRPVEREADDNEEAGRACSSWRGWPPTGVRMSGAGARSVRADLEGRG